MQKDYEIIDHGVEHEQYFQGCGVSLTRFGKAFTGIGASAYDALEDALEQAAVSGHKVDHIKNELPNHEVELEEDNYYYVSIRLT
jgi:hypothetical protein